MQEKDKRAEFMTQGEIMLADRLLAYYSVAWKDKQTRGLFDLWEKVESYWEGNPRAKEPNSPNSNINFVHPNIEGQVALLMEQEVNFDIVPTTKYDEAYTEQVQTMLEWVRDKNKMRRKIDVHERRREKFGTGVFRVLFDPDALNGIGLPSIEAVNPAYIFPDPAITDVYKIQQGSFLIETLNKSKQWAISAFGTDKAKHIQTGIDPIGNYSFAQGEQDAYLHIMAWIRTDGKLRLIQLSGDGIILEDSFEKSNEQGFYPFNQYPYFFTPLYCREGSVWAKGDAELLLSLQDLVDELDDQIRINARLSGNPQRLVDVSSNIDLDKWTNESGLIIPTSNINGAKYLNPPEMASYPMERRQVALDFERQMLTRFSDQMSGTESSTIKTATEAEGLLKQGETVIRHKKALLQETLSEVFDYCFKLIKEYWTSNMMFRLIDGRFESWNGNNLKNIATDNGTKEAEFDINIKIGE